MAEGKVGRFDFCQVGIVTKDLDRTLKEFKELYGLEPVVIAEPTYVNTYVRGEPTEINIRIALFRVTEQVDIELIEVTKGHTIYNEWLEEKGEGLHHLAFEVDDTEKWVEHYKGKGISVLQRGERTGIKFTYLDTADHSGVIFELLEREKGGKYPNSAKADSD